MAYVMIIDDDEDFAKAAGMVLNAAGHEVVIKLDTDEAVPEMKKRRPDLVVLDVMFPEDPSAGFELARKLRHHYDDTLSGIPVLMALMMKSLPSLYISPSAPKSPNSSLTLSLNVWSAVQTFATPSSTPPPPTNPIDFIVN